MLTLTPRHDWLKHIAHVFTARSCGICLANVLTKSVLRASMASCREVWRVPITAHSSLLPGLCKIIPLIDLLHKRMLKFTYRCLRSQSSVVNCVARHSILFCRMTSIMGCNATNCCLLYSSKIYNIINCNFKMNNIDRISATTIPEDSHINVTLLNELIHVEIPLLVCRINHLVKIIFHN